MIDCHLICSSNSAHLSQIYTGYALLHEMGEIRLSQECERRNDLDATKPQHLRDARNQHLLAIVNHEIKVYYDCHDSCEIDEAAANEVDYYFKRSYARFQVPDGFKRKIFPLGLNYEIYCASVDSFEQQRISYFWPQLTEPEILPFRPTVENMFAIPHQSLRPSVLFISRVYDPFDHPDRSKEKIAERMLVNETRANCVDLLRREFKDRFLGGFEHTDYAVKNYKHALLQNNELAEKGTYLNLLTQYPVCVTTTGLHGSIGWKLGEYVAFSRAIVSQRLYYEVSEGFKEGKNYLEFGELDQCVEAVQKLLSDTDLRYQMMRTNHEYYLCHLRPDALIRRTLKIALSSDSLK